MEKKRLIVYYSVSNGNTRRIAEVLQNATGADIARIDAIMLTRPCENEYLGKVHESGGIT